MFRTANEGRTSEIVLGEQTRFRTLMDSEWSRLAIQVAEGRRASLK